LFPSFAPGAEIFFRKANGPQEGKLDVASVISAIAELTRDEKVDLINVSAGGASAPPGAPDHPLAGLRSALRLAAQRGVLCFAPSGNDYENPVCLPAGFDECIGVGALGCSSWGKPGTYARHWATKTNHKCELDGVPLFHWPPSGHGPGLDVVAPGVGTFIGRNGRAAYDVTGTSFASPAACGALAVALANDAQYQALPRDSSRTARARDLLRTICRPLGIQSKFIGQGYPTQ
jgi:subtilisin